MKIVICWKFSGFIRNYWIFYFLKDPSLRTIRLTPCWDVRAPGEEQGRMTIRLEPGVSPSYIRGSKNLQHCLCSWLPRSWKHVSELQLRRARAGSTSLWQRLDLMFEFYFLTGKNHQHGGWLHLYPTCVCKDAHTPQEGPLLPQDLESISGLIRHSLAYLFIFGTKYEFSRFQCLSQIRARTTTHI